MRLLLLTTQCYGAPGGIQSYGRALIRASSDLLSETGALDVLALYDRTDDFPSRRLGDRVTFGGFEGGRRRFVAASGLAALKRPARIVLGHTMFLTLAPLLRVLSGGSVKCILYGIEAWAPWTGLQRAGAASCDAFVSISDYTRQQAAAINGVRLEKTKLLPCCLDPSWVPPIPSQESEQPRDDAPWRLLTVSRLSSLDSYKGIDTTLEAVALLDDLNIELWIVGDGDDRSRLQSIALEKGLGDRVRFLGRLADTELQRCYAQCDLFVLPSASEGFGIVYLEAASHRKPSLGANAGATPEVIVDGVTGALVPQGDSTALASKLRVLLSDRGNLQRLGAAAFDRFSAHFTFPQFRERLRDILFSPKGQSRGVRTR